MIRNRNKLIVTICFGAGALAIVLFLCFATQKTPQKDVRTTTVIDATVHIGTARIPVSIADSDSERIQGLSGTLSLPPGTGKLFIFEDSYKYSFWMKDMAYPIDIVWIGDDKRVVDVTKHATPESYPSTFSPSAPAQFVLELNSGDVERYAIRKGALVEIIKNEEYKN